MKYQDQEDKDISKQCMFGLQFRMYNFKVINNDDDQYITYCSLPKDSECNQAHQERSSNINCFLDSLFHILAYFIFIVFPTLNDVYDH